MDGRIQKIVSNKGFGFIAGDDTNTAVFFHASGCKDHGFDDLNVGDRVRFDLTRVPKGLRAENVVRI